MARRQRSRSPGPFPRIFLLSPANSGGERAGLLLRPRSSFPLAQQVRGPEGATIADVFTFASGLYFRGKRAYAERFAAIPGWVCVLAHLLAETDRGDEAREILDAFAADDFRGLPLDGIWLGAVGYLAETAAALGDATHAQALHDLLEPYADRNVAVGWASACTGSAARHLGLLADLLGRREQAIAYFETALAMNERMRARPWVAHTQIELARVLSQQASGRERAAKLLEAGLAEAQRLAMPRLTERGAAALATQQG